MVVIKGLKPECALETLVSALLPVLMLQFSDWRRNRVERRVYIAYLPRPQRQGFQVILPVPPECCFLPVSKYLTQKLSVDVVWPEKESEPAYEMKSFFHILGSSEYKFPPARPPRVPST